MNWEKRRISKRKAIIKIRKEIETPSKKKNKKNRKDQYNQ